MKFRALLAVIFGVALSMILVPILIADASTSSSSKHHEKQDEHHKDKHHKKHHHHKHHPYPGSVKTKTRCHVQSHVKRGKKVNFTYKVDADGNARPTGNVVIKVSRQSAPVRSFTQHYNGHGTKKTSLGSFSQPGQYSANASYEPDSGSVYQPSSCGDQSFTVK